MTEKNMMGDIGEALICANFGGRLSTNKYDQEKDLIIVATGEKVEVKTQVRYRLKAMMTVQPNQLRKCLEVDRLMFVEYDDTDDVRIWECVRREAYEEFTTKARLDMIGWKICDLILLKTISSPKISSMLRQPSTAMDILLAALDNVDFRKKMMIGLFA